MLTNACDINSRCLCLQQKSGENLPPLPEGPGKKPTAIERLEATFEAAKGERMKVCADPYMWLADSYR